MYEVIKIKNFKRFYDGYVVIDVMMELIDCWLLFFKNLKLLICGFLL